MVISKDDSFPREPRPQMVRSKSVGAITRRTHFPMDVRQHKKTPYASTGNIRKRRDSSSFFVSPFVTNSKDIPRNQGISDWNCNSTHSSCSVFKTLPSTWGLENTFSVSTGRYESLLATTPSNHLEKQLSVESRNFKGSNLPKAIDYFSKSLISLSAKNPHEPMCLATGTMTDERPPIFPGQQPGHLEHQPPQVMTNMIYVNSHEDKCQIQADSFSTGLAQMENFEIEFLASENNDRTCQQKLNDTSSLIAHQYSNHGAARRTRRPLATCNLQDNQLNIQRELHAGNTAESLHAGQSETCQQKQNIPEQMSSGTKMSQTFSCYENMTNGIELTCFASPQDGWNKCDADEAIHTPVFRDECLESTQKNADPNNILTDDQAWKHTDDINVPKCNDESNHQLSCSLRRQDTLLIQDKIDDDNADNGDFGSFFESLKKFLCQEIPDDDDILQEANTMEDQSDETKVSYKNLLNCPPRYQCAFCDSNLEVVPFRQYHGDCENEYFPFFSLEDSTSQTELYCRQCRCLRSIYCPE